MPRPPMPNRRKPSTPCKKPMTVTAWTARTKHLPPKSKVFTRPLIKPTAQPLRPPKLAAPRKAVQKHTLVVARKAQQLLLLSLLAEAKPAPANPAAPKAAVHAQQLRPRNRTDRLLPTKHQAALFGAAFFMSVNKRDRPLNLSKIHRQYANRIVPLREARSTNPPGGATHGHGRDRWAACPD